MMQQERCAVSFSGGKDSMLALDRSVRSGRHVDYLVTLYDAASGRVRFHGTPIALIQKQAEMLGVELLSYATMPETFEAVFLQALTDIRQRGVTSIVFGDIHLADVRAWYEERTTAAGLRHIEPLWGEAPGVLVRECIARGYRATLTCIELARAKPAWLGATLTEKLVQDFETTGIDPCGEYGEYHTFVSDGPLFARALPIQLGEVVTMPGYQLVDIVLQADC